jgi:hypothetical protein
VPFRSPLGRAMCTDMMCCVLRVCVACVERGEEKSNEEPTLCCTGNCFCGSKKMGLGEGFFAA